MYNTETFSDNTIVIRDTETKRKVFYAENQNLSVNFFPERKIITLTVGIDTIYLDICLPVDTQYTYSLSTSDYYITIIKNKEQSNKWKISKINDYKKQFGINENIDSIMIKE